MLDCSPETYFSAVRFKQLVSVISVSFRTRVVTTTVHVDSNARLKLFASSELVFLTLTFGAVTCVWTETRVQPFVRWHAISAFPPSVGLIASESYGGRGFVFVAVANLVYDSRTQETATISVNAAAYDVARRSGTCVGWRKRRENQLVFFERQKGRVFWSQRRRRWYTNVAITLRERAGGLVGFGERKNGGWGFLCSAHYRFRFFSTTHRPFSYRYTGERKRTRAYASAGGNCVSTCVRVYVNLCTKTGEKPS